MYDENAGHPSDDRHWSRVQDDRSPLWNGQSDQQPGRAGSYGSNYETPDPGFTNTGFEQSHVYGQDHFVQLEGDKRLYQNTGPRPDMAYQQHERYSSQIPAPERGDYGYEGEGARTNAGYVDNEEYRGSPGHHRPSQGYEHDYREPAQDYANDPVDRYDPHVHDDGVRVDDVQLRHREYYNASPDRHSNQHRDYDAERESTRYENNVRQSMRTREDELDRSPRYDDDIRRSVSGRDRHGEDQIDSRARSTMYVPRSADPRSGYEDQQGVHESYRESHRESPPVEEHYEAVDHHYNKREDRFHRDDERHHYGNQESGGVYQNEEVRDVRAALRRFRSVRRRTTRRRRRGHQDPDSGPEDDYHDNRMSFADGMKTIIMRKKSMKRKSVFIRNDTKSVIGSDIYEALDPNGSEDDVLPSNKMAKTKSLRYRMKTLQKEKGHLTTSDRAAALRTSNRYTNGALD